MLLNYIKIATRNLFRNKTFSLLHIGGLALSITASLLLCTYVASEWRYNRYHKNLPDLYRVLSLDRSGEISDYTPPALCTWLKSQFPEVKAFVRTNTNGEGSVTYVGADGRRVFRETGLAYADAGFFSIFTHPAVMGDPNLDGPQRVALSETYARKYFGTESPLGKTLILDNQFGQMPYTVTGVFQDMPEASDYRYDLLFSLSTLANPANLNNNDWAAVDTWNSSSYFSFFQLKEGTTPKDLEGKMNLALQTAFPDDDYAFRLQPFSEIHLGSSLNDPYPTFGNRTLMVALSSIAVLILLIAWINYINLATAQGLKKAQNVSIRRTIGASRWQVSGQYLTESAILLLLAGGISFFATSALSPMMSNLVGKELEPQHMFGESFALIFASVLVLGTLMAGAYVAWMLSGVNPGQTLRSFPKISLGGIKLRNALIVGQFTISIVFIIGTLVFQQQLKFMQERNLGMNLEQLLVIRGPEGRYGDGKERMDAFRMELEKLAFVEDYCFTGCLPGATFQQNFSTGGFSSAFSGPETEKLSFTMAMVDHQYQPVYELEMLAGQNFTETEARAGWSKSKRLMVNETAARQLGFDEPEKAAGQSIRWNDQTLTIAGVLRDYHHRGLQQAIDPMIFMPSINSNLITVRTQPEGVQAKIDQMKALFVQFFPNDPFDYYFESEDFDKQYTAERRLSKIISLAAFVAILLSCLGLFGLITFIIAQRTKEIGIRKVLGASIVGITGLLARDFLKLVFFAFCISAPIAWFLMERWLAEFAYRIPVQIWVFLLAGAAAVAIAFATVSFQSIRAALANPVKSLRSE
mgnify:CR=1 FL=1